MSKEEVKLVNKISKLFWDKGLNLSGGSKTTPAEIKDKDGNNILNKDSIIDIVNLGIEYSTGSVFVRGQYRGSKAWFQFPILVKHIPVWTERIHQLYLDSVSDVDDNENETDENGNLLF